MPDNTHTHHLPQAADTRNFATMIFLNIKPKVFVGQSGGNLCDQETWTVGLPLEYNGQVDDPGETQHRLIGQNCIDNFTGNILRLQQRK